MNVCTATIESCAAGRGHGVTHAQGWTLFVPGTVPGDVVDVEWDPPAGKRRWAVARAIRLLEASPHRVEPCCPAAAHLPEAVATACGGCPWMTMDYEEQLRQKVAIARHAYRAFSLPENVVPRTCTRNLGVRCRCRMNASRQKLGFFASLSSQVVDIRRCPALLEPEAHNFLRPFLPRQAALEIRMLQGQENTLHVTLDAPPAGRFEELAKACPNLRGLRIAGVDFGEAGIFVDTPGFGPLHLSSAGFFQPGPEPNALILQALEECLRLIPAPGPILEGYAGAGNCTRVLVRHGDVTAVESDPQSCKFFNENMELYKTSGGRAGLLPVSMEKAVSSGSLPRARTLVLDPPRTGVNAQTAVLLVETSPDFVVLISCDPAVGARDAAIWRDAGYRLEKWILIDTMPHTPHMEIVQLFSR